MTNSTVVIKQLTNEIEKLIVNLSVETTANLVEATPIDTGWARANWVPNLNAPIDITTGDRNNVSTGDQQAGLAETATSYSLPEKVFISNNVPYILDLNDGTSTQAPAGFVQIAIAKAIASVTRG